MFGQAQPVITSYLVVRIQNSKTICVPLWTILSVFPREATRRARSLLRFVFAFAGVTDSPIHQCFYTGGLRWECSCNGTPTWLADTRRRHLGDPSVSMDEKLLSTARAVVFELADSVFPRVGRLLAVFRAVFDWWTISRPVVGRDVRTFCSVSRLWLPEFYKSRLVLLDILNQFVY